MKKYIASVLIVFSFFINIPITYAASTTIFSDGFGTGSTDDTFNESPAWTDGGNFGTDAEKYASNNGNDNNSVSPDGGRFAKILAQDGYICRTINTSGYNNVKLSYYWRGDHDAENSDRGIVEIKSASGHNCSDSNGWTNLKSHDMSIDSSWSTQSAFTNAGMNNTSFLLRFRISSSADNEDFRVDGVSIVGDAIVVDTTIPVITMNGTDVTLEVHSTYTDQGATANDNIDGNITSSIVTVNNVNKDVVGDYTVTYNVHDAANNNAVQVTRNVHVVDTTAPIITRNGSTPVTVQVLGSYTDAGATASDNYDGDLTSSIVTTGTVDTNTVGSYTVHYNVTDAHSNVASEVTRVVNVVDQEAPSTTDDVPSAWQTTPVTVTLACTDNVACTKVYYTTDGNTPTTESSYVDSLSNFQFTINTDGQYTIKYFGTDESDNNEEVNTADNTLKIDQTNPSGSISSPVNFAHVKGTVSIVADVSDATSGIAKVEFWRTSEGTKYFDDTEAPYVYDWDTTTTGDGSHESWNIAVYDVAGNHILSPESTFILDNTIPVITLLGNDIAYVNQNASYTDAGAQAHDNIDGDITNQIVLGGTFVNTNTVGTYTITYNVADLSGNQALEVVRTVNVVSNENNENQEENNNGNETPVIHNSGNATLFLGSNPTPTPSVGQVLGVEKFIFTTWMKLGSRDGEVEELQKRLTKEGFYTGPIDAIFGIETDKAVREYQRAHPPLRIDGIVGPYTRGVLNQ